MVVIHDRLRRPSGDRSHRDQRVSGRFQGRGLGWAVVARGVQQRPLPGQPQVQFRAGLRHPLMLSRVTSHLGSVPVTRDRGPLVNVSP
jgi:hypothetical protein